MKIETLLCVIFILMLNFENHQCIKCKKFCDEYPEKQLDNLELWKYDFDTEMEPERTKRSYSDDNQVNKKDYFIETKLCDSAIVFTRPQKLTNTNNKLLTIVNHRNYTQFVRFENCLEPSFPCTRNVYPFNVKSFCHQNYHKVKLLAFDEENNCLLEDYFVVPSTCDCMIDKSDLFQGVHKNILNGE